MAHNNIELQARKKVEELKARKKGIQSSTIAGEDGRTQLSEDDDFKKVEHVIEILEAERLGLQAKISAAPAAPTDSTDAHRWLLQKKLCRIDVLINVAASTKKKNGQSTENDNNASFSEMDEEFEETKEPFVPPACIDTSVRRRNGCASSDVSVLTVPPANCKWKCGKIDYENSSIGSLRVSDGIWTMENIFLLSSEDCVYLLENMQEGELHENPFHGSRKFFETTNGTDTSFYLDDGDYKQSDDDDQSRQRRLQEKVCWAYFREPLPLE